MTALTSQDLRPLPTLELEKDCNFYRSKNFVEELRYRGLINVPDGDDVTTMRIKPGMSEAEVFCALPKEFSIYGDRQVTESQFGEQITFFMPATTAGPSIVVLLDQGVVTSVTYG